MVKKIKSSKKDSDIKKNEIREKKDKKNDLKVSEKKVEKFVNDNKKTNYSKKEEISELIGKIKEKRYSKYIIPIFCILLIISIAFYVRSGPITLSGLDERIKASTLSQIQNLIAQDVNNKYLNLDQFYKQEKVNKEFQKVLETGVYELNGQKIIIDEIVKNNIDNVKSQFQAENGQTYLNAIDPYHFLGLSWNYYNNGHTGTTLKEIGGDEVPWIDYKLAPKGVRGSKKPEFHIWLESILYKLNGLDKNIASIGERTKAVYLIPVFFSVLAGVICYLILRFITNDLFALLGSLLLVSVGTFVSRTIAGFVDTDSYNVFFPLLITLFTILSFFSKGTLKTLIYGALAGLSTGLFIWAWNPGWFIFIFLLLALISYLGFVFLTEIVVKKKLEIIKLKDIVLNDIITIISIIISSFVFVYAFSKQNIFIISYNGLVGSISSIASVSKTYIWPNVLSSVAELNPASFSQVISSVGGTIIFLVALLGLVFMSLDYEIKIKRFNLYNKSLLLLSLVWFLIIIKGGAFLSLIANSKLLFLVILFLPVGMALLFRLINGDYNNKVFVVILLSIWISGTIFMSLNGVRFILLLAPGFALAFGIGLYYLAQAINNTFSKEIKILDERKQKLVGLISILVIFLVLYQPIYVQADRISKGTFPNFDDAWYNSMYKIRDNSKEDAIITSWWDFGHFFAVASERRVTFDGGSQTTPRSHWVGRLLMENDEEKARDILRMLTCGGNEAHNLMLKYVNGTNTDAVKINKIIYQTLGKNISETRRIIKNNKYYEFSDEQVDNIMNYLACENPPENFLITSEDMVGKAGVWAHWGSWDFTRKYVYDNYNLKTPSEIAKEIDENVSLIERYVNEIREIDGKAKERNIRREDLINRWFADYPSYIPIGNKYEYRCLRKNLTISCENGFNINILTNKVSVPQVYEQNGLVLKRLVYPGENKTLLEFSQNEKGNVDALLIPTKKGEYTIRLMGYPLGKSLFTRLFYLNGYSTKYFDKFDDVRSATGIRVIVWKTIWEDKKEGDVVNSGRNSLENSTMKVENVSYNSVNN